MKSSMHNQYNVPNRKNLDHQVGIFFNLYFNLEAKSIKSMSCIDKIDRLYFSPQPIGRSQQKFS